VTVCAKPATERFWNLSVAGIGTAAVAHPETRLAIECKPEKPRTHILSNSAARTLLGVEETSARNIGIILGMGTV